MGHSAKTGMGWTGIGGDRYDKVWQLLSNVNIMSLKDRISEDIKTAMKAKDKVRLETVRSMVAS